MELRVSNKSSDVGMVVILCLGILSRTILSISPHARCIMGGDCDNSSRRGGNAVVWLVGSMLWRANLEWICGRASCSIWSLNLWECWWRASKNQTDIDCERISKSLWVPLQLSLRLVRKTAGGNFHWRNSVKTLTRSWGLTTKDDHSCLPLCKNTGGKARRGKFPNN